MHIPEADRTLGESEWRPFIESQGFGQLVAPGAGLEYPVIAPTQFVLDGDEVLVHFATPNPVLDAVAANPRAVMSVAGDWAFIPSDWKAIEGEDPELGIPTTYYSAVQLRGTARLTETPAETAAVLRRQLSVIQPRTPIADPEQAHPAELRSIRAVILAVEDVRAKFKYGGNVDEPHRRAVMDRLLQRAGTSDAVAAARVEHRLEAGR
ncbi:MAG: FMN-binding negative transcriptional regulator [Acidimicrobiales bacterium]